MRDWEVKMSDGSEFTIKAEKLEFAPSGAVLFVNVLPITMITTPEGKEQPTTPVDVVGIVSPQYKYIKPGPKFKGELININTAEGKSGSFNVSL